jgi:large subunit ribosomal protein L25
MARRRKNRMPAWHGEGIAGRGSEGLHWRAVAPPRPIRYHPAALAPLEAGALFRMERNMANFTTLEAASRERSGKGAARATRREGKVPAVIYGAKLAPSLVALDPRDVMKELQRGGWQSRLYEVKSGGETTRALMRDVQFHPVTDRPLHVDFQRLAAGEKMRVSVPVHFESEERSVGLKRGGMLNVVRHVVEVYADPDLIPEHFTADLFSLDINDNVRWSDLTGTQDCRPVIADRDFVIATIAAPTKSAEPEAAVAAAAAATPAAAAAPAKGAAPAKAAPAKPAGKK